MASDASIPAMRLVMALLGADGVFDNDYSGQVESSNILNNPGRGIVRYVVGLSTASKEMEGFISDARYGLPYAKDWAIEDKDNVLIRFTKVYEDLSYWPFEERQEYLTFRIRYGDSINLERFAKEVGKYCR